MIFENDKAAFRFINTVYISEQASKNHISNRSFCALSFRIQTDSEIIHGNQRRKMQNGDIAFFPVNTPYSRIASREELIAVHFEIFNDATKGICVYTPKNPEKFQHLFQKILEVYERKETGYIFEANALLNTVFMEIQRENKPKETHSEKFFAAKQYIEQNYANPQLTIKEIAKNSGVSEGYLRRIFQKEGEISPKRFLNSVRISHAASLLNCGFYSVSQVSEMVGFYDVKYFSSVYKKFTALKPSAYADNAAHVQTLFDKKTNL